MANKKVNTKVIAKQAAKQGTKKGIGKTIMEYAPITSDVSALTTGIGQFKTGHPYAGTVNTLLGLGGGALDLATLAEILGGATSPAAIPTQAAKAGLMASGKKMLQKAATKQAVKALANANKIKLLGPGSRTTAQVATDLAAWASPSVKVSNNKSSNNKKQVQQDKPTTNYFGDVSGGGGRGIRYIPQSTTNISSLPDLPEILQLTRGSSNNTDGQGVVNEEDIQQPAPVDMASIEDILNQYSQQQNIMQPYNEGLKNYIDNYNNLQNRAYWQDIFNTSLADLSGNEGYRKLVGQYNPAEIEATKLDLINKYLSQQATYNANRNEMLGNMVVAQQLGLPPEAALADKNLLNTMTAFHKADTGLEGRKYYADTNMGIARLNNTTRQQIANAANKVKMDIANMNNQRAYNIANGNWGVRQQLAYNRNKTSMINNLVRMAGQADPNAGFEVARQFGVNVKTPSIQGTGQQGSNYFQGNNGYFY